ncbi:MAG: hypothetical protein PHN44_08085 [Candidatus Marinimicrobia bacterium]|nr:hypothetical protein [Candidatus Neomarinimicrobiota bacterium]
MRKIFNLVIIYLLISFFLHSPINAQTIRTWKIISTLGTVSPEEANQYIDEINKTSSPPWRLPKGSECTTDKLLIIGLDNFEYNTYYLIKLYYTLDDEITETGEWDYAGIAFSNDQSYGYNTFVSKGKLILVSETSASQKSNDNGGGGGGGCFITSCFLLSRLYIR